MAAATSTTFYGLVLLALVVVAPHVEAAITCGQVASFLGPCRTYVVSGGVIPPRCCTGIGNLNNAAMTTPDRQAACRCLKSIISGIKGANPSLVSGLPSRCRVSIPYPISSSTNCNNVK